MVRTFLCTSLLLLLTTSYVFSAPIQFNDDLNDDDLINSDLDEYINDKNNNEDLLNDKLTDLGVNIQTRNNGYKKVLTFVKSLQNSIDKEHTDLTRIFNGQTKEHQDRKNQLDEALKSIKGLRRSLQNTQWKIGNLTKNLTENDEESSKVQNTINYHKQLLKEELKGINKFYDESDKYKKYKEFPQIKNQIDELKTSVHKEINDVIDVYSKLGIKINNDVSTKKKALDIFRQQEKAFNTSLNTQTQGYNNLFQSFQKFIDLYNKNSKDYESAKQNYNEEKILLDQLSAYLQQTNPEKCLQLTQELNDKNKTNKDLSNKLKELEKENTSLTKQITTLHKEIKASVDKSKSISNSNSKSVKSNNTNNKSGKVVASGKVVSEAKSKTKN